MRLYAAVCVLLTVGLLGREALVRHDACSSRVAVYTAETVPPAPSLTTIGPAAEMTAASSQPGLLTLLTLGAAVVGSVSTLSEGAALCASDACLAAHIVDRTAELHAVATESLPAGSLPKVVEGGRLRGQ